MSTIKLFETQEVRSHRDADKEAWFFGIVNVVAVPTSSADAGAYGRKLKQRLNAKDNETVTNGHGLKMTAPAPKIAVAKGGIKSHNKTFAQEKNHASCIKVI